MHNLSYLDFHQRNEGPSCLKGACVKTNIYIKQHFLAIFFLKVLKKSHLNTTEGEHQPSFSRQWGTGKLNQTDE